MTRDEVERTTKIFWRGIGHRTLGLKEKGARRKPPNEQKETKATKSGNAGDAAVGWGGFDKSEFFVPFVFFCYSQFQNAGTSAQLMSEPPTTRSRTGIQKTEM